MFPDYFKKCVKTRFVPVFFKEKTPSFLTIKHNEASDREETYGDVTYSEVSC